MAAKTGSKEEKRINKDDDEYLETFRYHQPPMPPSISRTLPYKPTKPSKQPSKNEKNEEIWWKC